MNNVSRIILSGKVMKSFVEALKFSRLCSDCWLGGSFLDTFREASCSS